MSRNKFPKDTDLAAGFFSAPATTEMEQEVKEKVTAPQENKKPSSTKSTENEKKNLGGRPRKVGLKNAQFTLTMNPETYEKLRIIAAEYTRGNFSELIDKAIESFCREYKIDLSAIEVAPEILDIYRKKQEKKNNKK